MTGTRTRIAVGVGLGLSLLAWALGSSLRLGRAEDWVLIASAAGPGVFTALAVGGALGLSGALRPARAQSVYPEFALLAAAAGGLAGLTLGRALELGPVWSAVYGLGLCSLGAAIVFGIGRAHRGWLAVQAAVFVLATAGLMSATVYWRAEVGGARAVYAWLLGDVSRASWAGAALLCAAVLGLGVGAMQALSRESARALGADGALAPDRRRWLDWLAWASFGLALGAAGPIAFVAGLAPRLARRLAGECSPAILALMSMLVGAGGLVAIEGALRSAIGGFALPLGPALALLGGPVCLGLHAAALRRAGAAPQWRGFRYLEHAIVGSVGLTSAFVLGSLIRALRAFLA